MRRGQWGAALELCAAAGLPSDTVYAARWASRGVDKGNIADNLAKMADRCGGRARLTRAALVEPAALFLAGHAAGVCRCSRVGWACGRSANSLRCRVAAVRQARGGAGVPPPRGGRL
jgi:hypothetical protein